MNFSEYCDKFFEVRKAIVVTDSQNKLLTVNSAFESILSRITGCFKSENTIFFVGNGGSASIAEHMAVDFWKNGKVKSRCFHDASGLTCLSNDCGYENVFSSALNMFAVKNDMLIAISSSGNSQNILNAVKAAKARACWALTLSGFSENNALRSLGDINMFIPNGSYGFVENIHSLICHYLLDKTISLQGNA